MYFRKGVDPLNCSFCKPFIRIEGKNDVSNRKSHVSFEQKCRSTRALLSVFYDRVLIGGVQGVRLRGHPIFGTTKTGAFLTNAEAIKVCLRYS